MATKTKKQNPENLVLERLLAGILMLLIALIGTAFMLSTHDAKRAPNTSFVERFTRAITFKSADDPLALVNNERLETPAPVSKKGDKGEVGEKGDTGPRGPKGDKGTAGAVGAAGSKGETGTTGAAGSSGTTNASDINSGTLADLRLSSNVTLQGNSFNGASQLLQLTAGGILPAISGANLTTLNGSNITSGTLSDARLSSNVALLDGTGPQTFSGNNKFTGSLTLGSSGTALSQIRSYAPTLNPGTVSAVTTSEQTFTVSGLSTSDIVIVNKTSHTAGCGIVNARVSATDTLALTFMNVLPALTCDPPSETYSVLAIR